VPDILVDTWLTGVFVLLFGLVIGSFLNVCIHRWPRDESIVWPGSRCPGCGHAIAAYDNIPVVSYLVLGGRCRHCRRSIHWRYPVAELATGLLFLWAWSIWGETGEFAKHAIMAALCVGMIFTDLETRLLPDEFTVGGAVLGVVLSYFVPRRENLVGFFLNMDRRNWASAAESIVGALLIAGLLWGLGEIFYRLRKVEYLGFGDVKMVAMMMAFLGLMPGIMAVFLGSALGVVAGGVLMYFRGKKARDYHMPFGTFLGVGAIAAAFVWR
jgi:leader peptidase (prepilin peptidase)/N-methyltransferase